MERTPKSESSSRVLIVEDNAAQLRTLATILRCEGFEVITCATGEEALKHFASDGIDVAIVDLRLPDMDEATLLNRLCDQAERVPVIVHTGYGSYTSARDAVNTGVFAYVEKGADPAELIGHVHRAVRNRLVRRAMELEEAVAERTAELRESEQRNRLLLEHAGLGIGYYALDGKCLFLNRKACKDMQSSPKDLVGRNAVDLFGATLGGVILRRIKQVAEHGRPHSFEDYVDMPTGRRWRASTYASIGDEHGGVNGIQIISMDITERKQAQDSLREAHLLLDSWMENSPSVAFVKDLDGRITFVNRAFERLFSLASGEILGKTDFDLFTSSPETAEQMRTNDRRVVETGQPEAFDETVTADSQSRFFETIKFPLRDSQGRVTALAGVATDVTKRKRAEEVVRESERRYRAMFHNNRAVQLLIDPSTGEIVDANPAACKFYGYGHDRLVGMYIWDINTLSMEEVRAKMELAMDEEVEHFDFRHRLASGAVRDVQVHSGSIPLGGRKLLYSIVFDVTDRKVMLDKLRESERRFKTLADMLPQAVYECDANGRLTYVNRRAYETFGYGVEDFEKGLHALEMLAPEDHTRATRAFAKALTGRTNPDGGEYLAQKKDGSAFPVVIYSSPIVHDKQNAGLRGIIVDISERKQAEQALQEAKDYTESIIHSMASMLLVVSPAGDIVTVNEATSTALGYAEHELIGRPAAIVFEEEEEEEEEEEKRRRRRRRRRTRRVYSLSGCSSFQAYRTTPVGA